MDESRGDQRALAIGWLLALVPGALLAVLLLRPVWDVDVFWQLKLGELILDQGGPLTREPFAALHIGQPMPTFAWLGQAIMAGVRGLAGWTGLRIVDAACWLGGFLAIALACRRRGASALGITAGLVAGFIVALPLASLRPQSFAVLCFGLLLALLRLRLSPGRTALLAVPLLLVWQNLHPSVSVALVPLGIAAAADWWARLRGSGDRSPWPATGLVLAALAAMFATPEGFGILAASAGNARESMAMGVSEWLPLWDPVNRTVAIPVLVVAAVTAWLAWRNRARIDPVELATAGALLLLTVATYRFALFWAVALVPVFARLIESKVRVPGVVMAGGLVAAAILTPVLRPTHFAPALPLAAIDRLHAAGVHGTVFAHFPWGGAVIDRGYPDWKVAYDGRLYRYSPEEWARYRATQSDPASLAAIERVYRPAGFLLDPQWNAALIAALRADSTRWRELPGEPSAVLFVPAL